MDNIVSNEKIKDFLLLVSKSSLSARLRRNVSLASLTTMRVGGKADLYTSVSTKDELVFFVKMSREVGLPYIILGGGSNVLVSDEGVRGLVIRNRSNKWQIHRDEDNGLTKIAAESGTSLVGLARNSIDAGLTGLEWATTVPGTVGGAIVGNAGAFGGDMTENLVEAEVLLENGDIEIWGQKQLNYSYRKSTLKERVYRVQVPPVVLSGTFFLPKGDVERSRKIAAANQEYRRKTQPQVQSVGSVFANPPGEIAGRLIESVGLKGYSKGGAQISTITANWIINPNNEATSSDVIFLINLARKQVKEQYGLTLTPEILFIGEWETFPPYDEI